MQESVHDLLERVRQSRAFTSRADSNVLRLLELYVDRYPHPPSTEEITQKALEGKGQAHVEINRLRTRLKKSFSTDRSLWSGQQNCLVIPPKPRAALEIQPIAVVLRPTLRFWFNHCLRLRGGDTETSIVFSEPLFFFSRVLGGYFRFLDINFDKQFTGNDVAALVRNAKDKVRTAIELRSHDTTETKATIPDFAEMLDLVPVRLYIPAGDAYAASVIRSWFRKETQLGIEYREALDVPAAASTKSNLIVLASRPSLPLVASFQEQNPHLRLILTEKGIKIGDKELEDEIGQKGARLAHVIVTCWVFETDNVHTYIISNHTRALERVARLLIDDKEMRPLSDVILDKSAAPRDSDRAPSGRIPHRFQLAFKVPLHEHEFHANPPELLPDLFDGRPIIFYGNDGRPRPLESTLPATAEM